MRYAYGVLIGALLSGVIFIGSAIIRVAGFGVSDPMILRSLWSAFISWFAISITLLIVPPIIVHFMNPTKAKEFLIFEVGGVAFFTPFWLGLAAELTGTPWPTVFIDGVENALPFLGPDGSIWGMNIGGFVVTSVMLFSLLLGLYLLRPSFIVKMISTAVPTTTGPPAKKQAPAKGGPPAPSIDAELPNISRPVADDAALKRLRTFLTELTVAEPVINALVSAGVTTLEDLVTTPADKLAEYARLDERTAKELYSAIQKKAWFSV